MKEKSSYVYILTNSFRNVFYVGMTSNLQRRIEQHQSGEGSKFTKKYNTKTLVYVEVFSDIQDAADWERKIKAGSRRKKVALVNKQNPSWEDLCNLL